MNAYWQLVRRNPGYARLWLAAAISLLGDWFNTIVLLALVSRFSAGSGVAISIFLLARTVPPLLVGPYAGVLADRFNRKHLMIASDLLRAAVVMGFLAATQTESLPLIYALTVAQFVLTAVFEPARSAVVPSLVVPDDLVRANTLDSITWSFMLTAGGVIGGVVAALIGTNGALTIDALTFLASAAVITTIRLQPLADAPAPAVSGEAAPRVDGSLRAGLRYAVQHPGQAAVLLVKAGGRIANTEVLTAIFATQVFVLGTEGEQSLGILYAAGGLGAVLGPVLLNRFHDGSVPAMRRLIAVGFGMILVGMLLMGGATSLWLVAVAMLVRSMGGSANWTYSSVIIQKDTPNAYLGRMFSLDMAAFQLVGVITTAATGWLVDAMGPVQVTTIATLLGIASALPLGLWLLALGRYRRKSAVATYAQSGD